MSQENVEIARRGYEHFLASGDLLEEIFTPDCVLDMSTFRGWPERQHYHGVEGFRSFLADWLEPWDDFELEVEEYHDARDKVVIVRARPRPAPFFLDGHQPDPGRVDSSPPPADEHPHGPARPVVRSQLAR